MQTELLLCWSVMTDTKYNTSGSNEEEVRVLLSLYNNILKYN